MKTNRTILFAAAALFAVTAVSCNKEENGNNGEETVYTLELADPEQAEIILENDETDPFTVELNTNLSKDQLSVTENDGKTWCSASIDDDCNISILPGKNESTVADLTATFTVNAVGIENVTPVVFTVTLKRAPEIDYNIEITSDKFTFMDDGSYGMYMYNGSGSMEQIEITINTDADQWIIYSTYGEEENPWYMIDPTSGASGESAYITVMNNTTGTMRNTTLTVSHENGSYGPTISLMQMASSGGATYAYVTDQTGTPVNDGSTINLESSSTSLTYNVESDGGLEAKFTGTDDPWYCGWLYPGIVDGVLSINVEENTSPEPRSVTMIITATGSEVSLVTLTFTQAGA